MRYFLLTIIFFIGFSFALPGVVVGQDAGAGGPQFTVLNPLSSITAGSPATDAAGDPVDFIQTIFNVYRYAQLVAVALAAIMITMGGINIAVSGAIDRQAEGKDMIKSAIFGLVLLFGANLILRTINPALTNLTPPHLRGSVMAVRKCDAMKDFDTSTPKKLISTDCAISCSDATPEQKSVCVDFCKKGEIPSPSNKCVQELPLCGEQETPENGPEQFPPECYTLNFGACNGPEIPQDAEARRQVRGCFSRRVKVEPGEFESLIQANSLTYLACADHAIRGTVGRVVEGVLPGSSEYPCRLENLKKTPSVMHIFDGFISEGEANNGLIILRYPFYRSSYKKPGLERITSRFFEGWPKSANELTPSGLGPETAQCLAYAYATFDDSGGQQEWKRLPIPGNSYEDWKRCEIDFNDPNLAGIDLSSIETLGGGTDVVGGEGSEGAGCPSKTEPPRMGCPNCAIISGSGVSLKEGKAAGESDAGCWFYPETDLSVGIDSCRLNSDLLTKINEIPIRISQGAGMPDKDITWRITEAWPPAGCHNDPCHSNGTCADIAIVGPRDCGMVALFVRAAREAKLTVLNEYVGCEGGVSTRRAVGDGHLHVH